MSPARRHPLVRRSDIAVTEAWALNGASAFSGPSPGLGGLLLGSRGLVEAAVPCYMLAWLLVLGTRSPLPLPSGEGEVLGNELEATSA